MNFSLSKVQLLATLSSVFANSILLSSPQTDHAHNTPTSPLHKGTFIEIQMNRTHNHLMLPYLPPPLSVPRMAAPAALHVVHLQLTVRKLIEHWIGRLDKTVIMHMAHSATSFFISDIGFSIYAILLPRTPTHSPRTHNLTPVTLAHSLTGSSIHQLTQ